MLYIYDYGDDWEHEVVLEKILPVSGKLNYPKCIGGERNRPPEDIGGIPGYEDFLKNRNNPEYEYYDEMMALTLEGFDPEKFNYKDVKSSFSSFNSKIHGFD